MVDFGNIGSVKWRVKADLNPFYTDISKAKSRFGRIKQPRVKVEVDFKPLDKAVKKVKEFEKTVRQVGKIRTRFDASPLGKLIKQIQKIIDLFNQIKTPQEAKSSASSRSTRKSEQGPGQQKGSGSSFYDRDLADRLRKEVDNLTDEFRRATGQAQNVGKRSKPGTPSSSSRKFDKDFINQMKREINDLTNEFKKGKQKPPVQTTATLVDDEPPPRKRKRKPPADSSPEQTPPASRREPSVAEDRVKDRTVNRAIDELGTLVDSLQNVAKKADRASRQQTEPPSQDSVIDSAIADSLLSEMQNVANLLRVANQHLSTQSETLSSVRTNTHPESSQSLVDQIVREIRESSKQSRAEASPSGVFRGEPPAQSSPSQEGASLIDEAGIDRLVSEIRDLKENCCGAHDPSPLLDDAILLEILTEVKGLSEQQEMQTTRIIDEIRALGDLCCGGEEKSSPSRPSSGPPDFDPVLVFPKTPTPPLSGPSAAQAEVEEPEILDSGPMVVTDPHLTMLAEQLVASMTNIDGSVSAIEGGVDSLAKAIADEGESLRGFLAIDSDRQLDSAQKRSQEEVKSVRSSGSKVSRTIFTKEAFSPMVQEFGEGLRGGLRGFADEIGANAELAGAVVGTTIGNIGIEVKGKVEEKIGEIRDAFAIENLPELKARLTVFAKSLEEAGAIGGVLGRRLRYIIDEIPETVEEVQGIVNRFKKSLPFQVRDFFERVQETLEKAAETVNSEEFQQQVKEFTGLDKRELFRAKTDLRREEVDEPDSEALATRYKKLSANIADLAAQYRKELETIKKHEQQIKTYDDAIASASTVIDMLDPTADEDQFVALVDKRKEFKEKAENLRETLPSRDVADQLKSEILSAKKQAAEVLALFQDKEFQGAPRAVVEALLTMVNVEELKNLDIPNLAALRSGGGLGGRDAEATYDPGTNTVSLPQSMLEDVTTKAFADLTPETAELLVHELRHGLQYQREGSARGNLLNMVFDRAAPLPIDEAAADRFRDRIGDRLGQYPGRRRQVEKDAFTEGFKARELQEIRQALEGQIDTGQIATELIEIRDTIAQQIAQDIEEMQEYVYSRVFDNDNREKINIGQLQGIADKANEVVLRDADRIRDIVTKAPEDLTLDDAQFFKKVRSGDLTKTLSRKLEAIRKGTISKMQSQADELSMEEQRAVEALPPEDDLWADLEGSTDAIAESANDAALALRETTTEVTLFRKSVNAVTDLIASKATSDINKFLSPEAQIATLEEFGGAQLLNIAGNTAKGALAGTAHLLGGTAQVGVKAAQLGFGIAQGVENTAFAFIPGATLAKKAIQPLLPAAAVGAGALMLPGGVGMATNMIHMSQGMAAPFIDAAATGAGSFISSQVGGAISGGASGMAAPIINAISGSVSAAAGGAVEAAITGAGTAIATAAPFLMAGKAATSVGKGAIDVATKALPGTKEAMDDTRLLKQAEQTTTALTTATIEASIKEMKRVSSAASTTLKDAKLLQSSNPAQARVLALEASDVIDHQLQEIDRQIKALPSSDRMGAGQPLAAEKGRLAKLAKEAKGLTKKLDKQVSRMTEAARTKFDAASVAINDAFSLAGGSGDENRQALVNLQKNAKQKADRIKKLVKAGQNREAEQLNQEFIRDAKQARLAIDEAVKTLDKESKARIKRKVKTVKQSLAAFQRAAEKRTFDTEDVLNIPQQPLPDLESAGTPVRVNLGAGEEIGEDLGQGLIIGLEASEPKAKAAAMEFSEVVIDAVEDSFGIQSPSRVAKGWARNIVFSFVDELQTYEVKIKQTINNLFGVEPEQNFRRTSRFQEAVEESEKARESFEKTSKALKEIEEDIDEGGSGKGVGIDPELKGVEGDSFKQLAKDAFGQIPKFAVGAIGLATLVPIVSDLAKESIVLQREFDGVATGLALIDDGAEVFEGVRSQVKRLGGDLIGTTRQAVTFTQALMSSELREEAPRLFLSANESLSRLGIGTERVQRGLLAVTQIAGKGKVSLEELSGQIGELGVPGVALGAQALGTSTEEFIARVSAGDVIATDFLPAFFSELDSFTAAAASQYENSLNASFGRLDFQRQDLTLKTGEFFAPKLKVAVDLLATGLEKVNENFQIIFKLSRLVLVTLVKFVLPIGLIRRGMALISTAFGNVVKKTITLNSVLLSGLRLMKALTIQAFTLAGIQIAFEMFEDGGKEIREGTRALEEFSARLKDLKKDAEIQLKIRPAPVEDIDVQEEYNAGGFVGFLDRNPVVKLYRDIVSAPSDLLGKLFPKQFAARSARVEVDTFSEIKELQRLEATTVRIDEIVKSNADALPNLFDAGTVEAYTMEIRALDEQINALSGRAKVLKLLDPTNNADEVEKINRELEELRSQRKALSDNFVPGGQARLDRYVEEVQNLVDLLVVDNQKGIANDTQLSFAKTLLEQLTRAAEQYRDVTSQINDQYSKQRTAIRELEGDIARITQQSAIRQSQARTGLFARQLSGELAPRLVDLELNKLEVAAQKENLRNLRLFQRQRKAIIDDIDSNTRATIETAAGQSLENLDAGGLAKIQNLISTSGEEFKRSIDDILPQLEAYINAQTELTQANEELVRSQAQLNEALRQRDIEIRGFRRSERQLGVSLRQLQRQREELEIQREDAFLQSQETQTQLRRQARDLERAYSDLGLQLELELAEARNALNESKNKLEALDLANRVRRGLDPGGSGILRQVADLFEQQISEINDLDAQQANLETQRLSLKQREIAVARQIEGLAEQQLDLEKQRLAYHRDMVRQTRQMQIAVEDMEETVIGINETIEDLSEEARQLGVEFQSFVVTMGNVNELAGKMASTMAASVQSAQVEAVPGSTSVAFVPKGYPQQGSVSATDLIDQLFAAVREFRRREQTRSTGVDLNSPIRVIDNSGLAELRRFAEETNKIQKENLEVQLKLNKAEKEAARLRRINDTQQLINQFRDLERQTQRQVRSLTENVADATLKAKGFLTVQEQIEEIGIQISREYRDRGEQIQDQIRDIERQITLSKDSIPDLEAQAAQTEKGTELLKTALEVQKSLNDEKTRLTNILEQNNALRDYAVQSAKALEQIERNASRQQFETGIDIQYLEALSYDAAPFESIQLRIAAATGRVTAAIAQQRLEIEKKIRLREVELEVGQRLLQQLDAIEQVELSKALIEANPLLQTLESGFVDLVQTGVTNFEDLGQVATRILQDISNQMLQLLAQFAFRRFIAPLFGGLFGGGFGGGAIAGGAGSLLGFRMGGQIPSYIPNFATGGPIGAFHNFVMAVERARVREGPKATLVMASEGEQILSQENGDAQMFRRLQASKEWDRMKSDYAKHGKISNYRNTGTVGATSPSSSVMSTQSNSTSTRQSTLNIGSGNITFINNSEVYNPMGKSKDEIAREQAQKAAFLQNKYGSSL